MQKERQQKQLNAILETKGYTSNMNRESDKFLPEVEYPMGERGTIEVIMGPMFSGKSTELRRKLQRHLIACKKVLLIKHSSDLRYEGSQGCVVTHDQQKIEAQLMASELDTSLFLREDYQRAEVVGIDEAQFFGANLPTIIDRIAHEGKKVIVAGLDGDYRREQFGYLIHLIPMAEKVKKMSAVCLDCNQKASFTLRTKFNDSSHKADQVAIVGGIEMYKPVCRQCYNATLRSQEAASREDLLKRSAEISPLKGSNEETMAASQSDHQHRESGRKRTHKQARAQMGHDSMSVLTLQRQESCELENIINEDDDDMQVESSMASNNKSQSQPQLSAAECFKRARTTQN